MARSGELVSVDGTVVNVSGAPLLGVTIEVDAGAQPFYAQTTDIGTDDTFEFFLSIPVTAAGTLPLTGRLLLGAETLDTVEASISVGAPQLDVSLEAPIVAGLDPITLVAMIANTGQVTAHVLATWQGPSTTVARQMALAPAATTSLSLADAITGDTLYVLSLTGDVVQSLTTAVDFGLASLLAVTLPADVLAGQVFARIYARNVGLLGGSFDAAFVLSQSGAELETTQRSYPLDAPENGLSAVMQETLSWQLAAGDYDLDFAIDYGSAGTASIQVWDPQVSGSFMSEATYAAGAVLIPFELRNQVPLQTHADVTVQLWSGGQELQADSFAAALSAQNQSGSVFSGVLAYNLAPGSYQLLLDGASLPVPVQTNFDVLGRHDLLIDAYVVDEVSCGTRTVRVAAENVGAEVLVAQADLRFVRAQQTQVLALEPGATTVVEFEVDVQTWTEGLNVGTVDVVDATGAEITSQSLAISVQPPTFTFASLPEQPTFLAGGVADLQFGVANRGDLAGSATVELEAFERTDTVQADVEACGQVNVAFAFPIPSDLEERVYDGHFAFLAADGRTVAPDRGILNIYLEGVAVAIDASVDQALYRLGDKARLTLEVTSTGSVSNVVLEAQARYNGFEAAQSFVLGSQPVLLEFDLPVESFEPNRVNYGVFFPTGRTAFLGSLFLHEEFDGIRLFTDRLTYAPAETVYVTVESVDASAVALTADAGHFGTTLTLAAGVSETVAFDLPQLISGGTKNITYTHNGTERYHFFYVDHHRPFIRSVDLTAPTYYPGQIAVADIVIESDTDPRVYLHGRLERPDRSAYEAFSDPVSLAVRYTFLSEEVTVETEFAGIHDLHVEMYLDATHSVFLSNAIFPVDVGGFELIDFAADGIFYELGFDDLQATATLYSVTDISGELVFVANGEELERRSLSFNGFHSEALSVSAATFTVTGPVEIKATFYASGLRSERAAQVDLIDTTAPELTVIGVANEQVYGHMVTPIAVADDMQPTDLSAFLNGEPHMLGSPITADGHYVLSITATDSDLNATFAQFVFEIDLQAPVVFFNGIADGLCLGTGIDVEAAALDLNQPVLHVSIDGQPVANPSFLDTEGIHELSATATDIAGNLAVTTVRVTIDRTVPQLDVFGVVPEAHYRGAVTPSVVISDINLSSTTIELNGSAYAPGTTIAAEGGHFLFAIAHDCASNEVRALVPFVIDRTPPAIEINGVEAGGVYRDIATVEVRFLELYPLLNVVRLNGLPITTFALTISDDGLHELEAEASDQAGNQAQAQVFFGIDAVAPTLIVVPAAGHYGTAITVTVSASDSFGAFLEVLMNGETVSAVTTVAVEGVATFYAEATDAVGHVSTRLVTYVVDLSPPVISVTSPEFGRHYPETQPVLFAVTDVLGEVTWTTVRVDGAPHFGGYVTEEGAHVLQIAALDDVGYRTEVSVPFALDFSVPLLTIDGVSPNEITSRTVVVEVEGLDLLGDVVIESTLNGSSFPLVATADVEGAYYVEATATDEAGNTTTAALGFEIDRTPPDILLLPPGIDGQFLSTPQVVQAVIGDLNLATAELRLNGISQASLVATAAADDNYVVEAIASDLAGNYTVETIGFVIDTVAPEIVISGVSPGQTYQSPLSVSVSIQDANLLFGEVFLDGVLVPSNFSVETTGVHELFVSAEDLAGNSAFAAVTFAIDVTIETETITLTANSDTYLKSGSANKNQGDETIMRIRKSGSNRSLVRFDQAGLVTALAGRSIDSALLRLYVDDNGNNWGDTGRSVSVHRVVTDWPELNATWNCSNDPNPANSNTDGCPEWNQDDDVDWPIKRNDSDRHTQYKNETGWKSWDVGGDVLLYALGLTDNFGWMVRKTNEGKDGRVDYSTREGSYPPELSVVVLGSGNQPPIADSFQLVVPQGVSVRSSFSGSDPDDTPVAYQVVTPHPQLTIDIIDPLAGVFDVQATAGYIGPAPFVYGVYDGQHSVTAVVDVMVTGAAPVTTTLTAIADTDVRSGNANKNYGDKTKLQVEQSGLDRALVRFDQSAIVSTIGNGTLVRALLRLYINSNGNNWGDGRLVGVHRLTTSWTELGATWNCTDDPNTSNSNTDGCVEWNMTDDPALPFVRDAIDFEPIYKQQKFVWVDWDVTADVLDFVGGTELNHGWVVRKLQEGKQGRVHFGSRESAFTPELQLTVMPE